MFFRPCPTTQCRNKKISFSHLNNDLRVLKLQGDVLHHKTKKLISLWEFFWYFFLKDKQRSLNFWTAKKVRHNLCILIFIKYSHFPPTKKLFSIINLGISAFFLSSSIFYRHRNRREVFETNFTLILLQGN